MLVVVCLSLLILVASVMQAAFGPFGAQLIGVIVGVATLTSINATMIVGARTNYALGRDWPLLVAVLNRLAVLRPDMPEILRDRGLAYAQWGVTERALEDLERFLQSQQGAQAVAVREVIRRLRGL